MRYYGPIVGPVGREFMIKRAQREHKKPCRLFFILSTQNYYNNITPTFSFLLPTITLLNSILQLAHLERFVSSILQSLFHIKVSFQRVVFTRSTHSL